MGGDSIVLCECGQEVMKCLCVLPETYGGWPFFCTYSAGHLAVLSDGLIFR